MQEFADGDPAGDSEFRAQLMHVDAPASAYVLIPQISQTFAAAAPRAPEYLPARQLEHADNEEAARVLLYVPLAQSKQRSAKAEAKHNLKEPTETHYASTAGDAERGESGDSNI